MSFFIPGYARLKAGDRVVVATESCAPAVKSIVEQTSLFDYAAAQPGARELHGRGPAYAISLPEPCGRVVVRHARRGGWVAQFSDDLFLSRIRALRELVNSVRLRLLAVPTPELIAYVIYPAGIFIRYDVATREIEHGTDMAELLRRTSDPPTRTAVIEGAAVLLHKLVEAGAHHPDLNAKNILFVPHATGFEGVVIDVDRVRFHASRSPVVATANAQRLQRSLRKLRVSGIDVTDQEIELVERRAKELDEERRAAESSVE